MVEWLLRGEFPILRFIKDFGIFGVLRREFFLNLLHCLGQGGGKCEFSDVGMAFSQYSLEGGCISLLGINLSGIFGLISFYSSEVL